MKKRISWASQCFVAPLCCPCCVWSGDQTLLLVCGWWWWSRGQFVVVFWLEEGLWVRQAPCAPHRTCPAALPRSHMGCVQGQHRGAAQACSQLFEKQNKDSQNNARGIEILFLVLSRNGESPDQFAFFQSQLVSQWPGQMGMDPEMESCHSFVKGMCLLSHCSQSHCC